MKENSVNTKIYTDAGKYVKLKYINKYVTFSSTKYNITPNELKQ